jgi:nucleoside-diphosphate-sugar epimerase
VSAPISAVLVTGAAGRLGSTVAAVFHEEGYDVLATDVVDPGAVPYRFERVDLLDHAATGELLEGVDAVLHIGNHPGIGERPPQVVFNENVSMNENVFQAAAERGVRHIVFASTVQLIGSHVDTRTVVDQPDRPSFPLSGSTRPTPSNLYALSKTVSEVMLRYYADRCGVHCTALRFPMLHRHEDWVTVASGEERPIDIFEGFTGLTYDDAAALFLAVVRAALPGYRVYVPATAHRHRDLDVADLVRAFYPDVAPDIDDLVDTSAITAETGWQLSTGYRRRSPIADRP